MSGDKHSKTEAPTRKRLRKARSEGQIPKNPEVASWLSLLVVSFLLPLTIRRGRAALTESLAAIQDQARDPAPNQLAGLAGRAVEHGLEALLPLVGSTIALAVVLHVAQGGARLATKNLGFKAKRLNPLTGVKRMFGIHGLQSTGKSLLKTVAIGLLSWSTVRSAATQLSGTPGLSLEATIGIYSTSVIKLMRTIAFVAVIIAIGDGAITRRSSMSALKMTKHEVKEEAKQAEGNPEVKQAIRRRMYAVSRSRMMKDVARADVVLANPTHVAVALVYVRGKGAPRVVAKGAGAVAARIRAEAEKHRVPIVVDVPLARAIYREVDLGREIPTEMFAAVARVLAFVMSLRRRGAHAGTHRNPHARLAA